MTTQIRQAALLGAFALLSIPAAAVPAMAQGNGKYALVNGLKMYYEVHGTGKPLVLLHGAFSTLDAWGPMLPVLAKNRQVITVELQGHGRTGDIDRPMTFEALADDVAGLLRHLQIKEADVFGYSMGGNVALQLAMKHPDLVRKLAVLGTGTGSAKDTFDPATYAQFSSITPENFNFPVLKDPYTKVAPDPSKWPVLVAKVLKMETGFRGFETDVVKAIKAPTLIMMGDRDAIRVEHAIEMYRTIPKSQLAVLPGADHFALFSQMESVLGTLVSFLDATPETQAKEGPNGRRP